MAHGVINRRRRATEDGRVSLLVAGIISAVTAATAERAQCELVPRLVALQ